jgi:Concanavalin A-like lectin/glucanases superfamily
MNPPLCHLSSNGIVGLLQSTETVDELRNVTSDTLAMEVWLTMLEDYATSTPILAFARDGYALNSDCYGYQMALTQRGRWLELRYMKDKDCRVTVLRQKELTRGRLQQVAIIWSRENADIYFDGVLVTKGAQGQLDPTLNDLRDLKLFLMGSDHDFGSSLNMLSFYNQAISESDVKDLYVLGKMLLDQARIDRLPLKIQSSMAGPVLASTQDMSTAVKLADIFDLSALNATAPNDWITLVEMSNLPRHGALLNVDGAPVHLHDRLLYPAKIFYRPAAGYFNAPTTAHSGTKFHFDPETFSFRLVAVDRHQMVLAASTDLTLRLAIFNVNHPPVLTSPQMQTLLSMEGSSGSSSRPIMNIHGIEVIDAADKDLDRIRVDLWVKHGTLTLENLEYADFVTCQLNERNELKVNATWGCHGSGTFDRSMTFVATPTIASRALSDIVYNGFRLEETDELIIRVYDGAGGSCLSMQEHQKRYSTPNATFPYSEYHDKASDNVCFEVELVIPIPSFSEGLKNKPEGTGGSVNLWFDNDDFTRADGIFLGLTGVVALCCCVSFRRCLRGVGVRGTQIHDVDSAGVDAANGCNEQRNEVV